MFKAGSGTSGFEDPEHLDGRGDPTGLPAELRALLETISHQIAQADQRHSVLLHDMRDRLLTLANEAERVRLEADATSSHHGVSIETSISRLSERLAHQQDEASAIASENVANAPAPLKSAAGIHDAPNHADSQNGTPLTSSIDPFDLLGDAPGDGDQRAWNASDAEALTRIYEESDAALVRSASSEMPPTPEATHAARLDDPLMETVTAPPTSAVAAELPAMMVPLARTPSDVPFAACSQNKDWLDARLSEIADRIEQSLTEIRPEVSIGLFDERFDAFETRMGSVLADMASRSDVESLAFLEGQINELTTHVENAQARLERLDTIEQQLQAVIEHLAEHTPDPSLAAMPQNPPPLPDYATLADAVAEAAASRFTRDLDRGAHDQNVEQMSEMLRAFIDDRRQNDDQTYTMLDTVQQALIRLLDRIDTLEVAHARAQASQPLSRGLPEREVEPQPTGTAHAAQDATMPARHTTWEHPHLSAGADDDEPAHRAIEPQFAAHPEQPAGPAQMSQTPSPVSQSSVNKLRQDFIADAQRAKLRASAGAAEAAHGDAEAGASPIRSMPRPKAPSAAAPPVPAESGGILGKLRLTALALGLVIAVSGGALLMKTRKAETPPPAPAATLEKQKPAAMNSDQKPEAPAKAAATAKPEKIASPKPPSGASAAPRPEDVMPAPPAPANKPRSIPQDSDALLGLGEEVYEGEFLEQKNELRDVPPQLNPEGIVLQHSERAPTPQELAHLQLQQNAAALSSKLGLTAGRLSPAALMPEEVARVAADETNTEDLITPESLPFQLAALPATEEAAIESHAAPSGPSSPVRDAALQSSLALPPATVGPLSLRIAASKGDPSAAFEVGARLAEGKGTPQNFKEALTWYQRSAGQGFAQAQYRLGTLYERGLGVKADHARARLWYQRAAEQGNAKAMHNLAVLSAGRESGSPDYTTAAQWFQNAAEYGLADSQYNLAVLHENGLGATKDDKLAYKWYALAARLGDSEAVRRRDETALRLKPHELEDAEIMVQAFTPKRLVPLVNDPRVAGEDWKRRESMEDNG